MAKVYEVTRSTGGQIGVLVKVVPGGGARLLQHCVYHSPTGFETGYCGSGPADLALSILADFFGASPKQIANALKAWDWDNETAAQRALKLHQDFKEHFIAPQRLEVSESYEISGDDIHNWAGVGENDLGECEDCHHPWHRHNPKEGCTVELGDRWVEGENCGGLVALPPCGCKKVPA